MSKPDEPLFNQIAEDYIKEQKRKRRWGIFFKLVYLVVVIIAVFGLFSGGGKDEAKRSQPHIAVIKVQGVIADDSNANAARINESLRKAYQNPNTKAVIVEINSPGGSPVQSDDIYQYMRYLNQSNRQIPLIAVCTDLCASGGYYIAAGATDIYANPMSIVGSIGVRAGGFGFVGLMDKVGVERRLYTAGKDKGFLDPFSPQQPQQVAEMEKMLSQTHNVFIQAIQQSRGDRIQKDDPNVIFSGEPFSGVEAKNLGLIDGFASAQSLARTQLNNLPMVDYTEPLGLFDRISSRMSAELGYHAVKMSGLQLQ